MRHRVRAVLLHDGARQLLVASSCMRCVVPQRREPTAALWLLTSRRRVCHLRRLHHCFCRNAMKRAMAVPLCTRCVVPQRCRVFCSRRLHCCLRRDVMKALIAVSTRARCVALIECAVVANEELLAPPCTAVFVLVVDQSPPRLPFASAARLFFSATR